MQPQLSNSCCFSGHRPDKLPPEQSPEGRRLRALLREMVRSKLREGCTHFYCGMAGARISGSPKQFSRWPRNSRPWASASIPWCLSPGRGETGNRLLFPLSRHSAAVRTAAVFFCRIRPLQLPYAKQSNGGRLRPFSFYFRRKPGRNAENPMRMPCRNQRKRLVYDPKTRRLYSWPHEKSIASILHTFPL